MNPMLLTDFYKIGHPFQYPKGTEYVYSNLTPRKSRLPEVNEMVLFGLQYFIKAYLIDRFDRDFFEQDLDKVLNDYKRVVKASLGTDLPDYEHIAELHDHQRMPVIIKALPEGSRVPMRVPYLTIVNTEPRFYWVTNFLETLMSSLLWQPSTSATLAYEYRKLLNGWADKTGMDADSVQWQGHDFSFRGMSSLESAILSGMGHLLSFTGTDTIPAILALEEFYGADCSKELVGGSVAATEHSVMCAGGCDKEFETFKSLITEVYPNGILSIVSDTWNLWKVLTDFMPRLKDVIMARDGKIVIRPDSGDPVDIICGKSAGYAKDMPELKGVIELLDNTFGHTTNKQGYMVLNDKVGAIYGDSITLSRANQIAERLAVKGYASQCVLGIGSYTYQYNTRDTFGLAMKATNVVVNGESRAIFKTPVTDDGTKNSAKGLLRVERQQVSGKPDSFILFDQQTPDQEAGGALETVFKDGVITRTQTLKEVRKVLWPDL